MRRDADGDRRRRSRSRRVSSPKGTISGRPTARALTSSRPREGAVLPLAATAISTRWRPPAASSRRWRASTARSGTTHSQPDGKRLAFVGTLAGKPVRSYSQPDLWVVDRPGGAPRNLTAAYDFDVDGGLGGDQRAPRGAAPSGPVWSRDGRSHLHQGRRAGRRQPQTHRRRERQGRAGHHRQTRRDGLHGRRAAPEVRRRAVDADGARRSPRRRRRDAAPRRSSRRSTTSSSGS